MEGRREIVASLDFPTGRGTYDPFMGADFTGRRPQLWVAGCPETRSLLRIEDTGKELKVVEDLADRAKTVSGFAARMVVDKEAELVYVNDGVAANLRYDGRTGKYAGQLDRAGRPVVITGSEFCVRRDGMIYRLAGKSWKGKISRLNRDLTPAPLADGTKEFGWYYGRMGGGYFGNHGCAVAPDGRLLMMGMYTWCQYAVMEFGPDGKPTKRPWLADYNWTGDFRTAGINSALLGWLPTMCGGVVLAPGGHVYVGLGLLPREHKLPESMASINGYKRMSGSVIKFKPTGGAVHPDDGRNGQTWKNGNVTMEIPAEFKDGIRMGATRTQHGVWLKKTFLEGAVRAYAGLAPFSGFDRSDACVCQTPRFDVDGFGRVYIPNALTCSVTVVDDAGNAILRFGEYGNFDGTRSGIPLAYPICVGVSVKSIYVADSANRRVVRVDPTWAAEAVLRAK